MTDPAATIDPQWIIDTNTANIANLLAPYDPVTATIAWFDTLRAIEDCINLPMADWNDDEFEARLYNLALPPWSAPVRWPGSNLMHGGLVGDV